MERRSKSKSAELIIQTPHVCRMCQEGIWHPRVTINSIKADDSKWVAKGTGKTTSKYVRCLRCKAIYEHIIHTVPVLCEPFNCPKCGQSENLKYKVNSITTEKDSFEFEVEIECETCSNKRSIKKMLKSLFDILKIEVGPSGIIVKKG